MKEFKLPEKWILKLSTFEISKTVSENGYYKCGTLHWSDNGHYCNCYIDCNKNYSANFNSSYIEITFEQFKQYVLKEKVEVEDYSFIISMLDKLEIC
mgnify:CR=1 FL=1|tara:strand:- start:596 stop:886 length:291 start_codon:yes stop_codon:yes gene_type:complete